MDENLIKLFLPALRVEKSQKAVTDSKDGDASLILPLIILLVAEGHDITLIIALLSILL